MCKRGTFHAHVNTLFTHFLGWNGRISRGEWWLCWGVEAGLVLVFFYVFKIDDVKALGPDVIQTIASGFLLWAATCANIKRFHDRNKNAVWALIAFVPAIGTVWTRLTLKPLVIPKLQL